MKWYRNSLCILNLHKHVLTANLWHIWQVNPIVFTQLLWDRKKILPEELTAYQKLWPQMQVTGLAEFELALITCPQSAAGHQCSNRLHCKQAHRTHTPHDNIHAAIRMPTAHCNHPACDLTAAGEHVPNPGCIIFGKFTTFTDLWPFDLKTGTSVTFVLRNAHINSRFCWLSACTVQTDRRARPVMLPVRTAI